MGPPSSAASPGGVNQIVIYGHGVCVFLFGLWAPNVWSARLFVSDPGLAWVCFSLFSKIWVPAQNCSPRTLQTQKHRLIWCLRDPNPLEDAPDQDSAKNRKNKFKFEFAYPSNRGFIVHGFVPLNNNPEEVEIEKKQKRRNGAPDHIYPMACLFAGFLFEQSVGCRILGKTGENQGSLTRI